MRWAVVELFMSVVGVRTCVLLKVGRVRSEDHSATAASETTLRSASSIEMSERAMPSALSCMRAGLLVLGVKKEEKGCAE